MEERRKYPRRKTSYYLPLVDIATGKIFGHLIDIAPQGLMVDSRQELPVGRSYQLRMDVSATGADVVSIEFTARTKWCRVDPLDPSLYDIGLEIIQILPKAAKILQFVMERYSD